MRKEIKIKALKYPNIPHYEWEGELIQRDDVSVLVLCKPGRKLIHHTKNKIFTMTNTSLEYFSLKEWFTSAAEIKGGEIKSYYCNVAQPSILEGDEVRFVDLDLDYVKRENQTWEVFDVDEFEENSIKYGYPNELRNEALRALQRLKDKVKEGVFPFNRQILDLIK